MINVHLISCITRSEYVFLEILLNLQVKGLYLNKPIHIKTYILYIVHRDKLIKGNIVRRENKKLKELKRSYNLFQTIKSYVYN